MNIIKLIQFRYNYFSDIKQNQKQILNILKVKNLKNVKIFNAIKKN